MPSSYTSNLRFTLPATGELSGAWGVTVNNGITSLVDASISGTTTITAWGAGDYTLTVINGAIDEARRMFILASGSPGADKNIICPAVSKLYFVTNSVAGGFSVTLKTAAGTGITVPNGASMLLRCDGTNVVSGVTSLASPALTGVPTAPTATVGTATDQIATTSFVAATSFSTNLPGQLGNAGKYLSTDGAAASWQEVTVQPKYEAIASGSLANGDAVVINSNGTVSVVSGNPTSFVNYNDAPVVFESANILNTSIAYDANAQKVVIAYRDNGNSGYGTAVVGTVSSTSISFGTPVVFESAPTNRTSIVYDANAQKVVIAYQDNGNSNYGTAIVGTVSGTSISFGTPVVFESATTNYPSIAYDANAQKVVIAYVDQGNSNYGTAIVGTVAGTSISFGTPVVFESASTAYTSIAYDANAQKVVIAYADQGNSDYGTAIVGTVSGTSISFGAAVVFESAITVHISIAYDANAQKVVIAYADFSNSIYGNAVVGTVSGTSISFGAPVVFESATTIFISIAYDASAQKVVIAYTDDGNSGYGTAVVGTVSGTSISFGTPVVFESAVTYYISIAYDASAQKVVIPYADQGNSGYGTAFANIVSGTSVLTPVSFGSYVAATYDSTNQKVVIAYNNTDTGYGTAVVGTVSGTSLSFGIPALFESASTSYTSIAYDANAQKVVIAYRDNGNSGYGTVIVGAVSGTSIFFGIPAVFESASTSYTSIVYDANAQKVVIAYQDNGNSNYGTAIVGAVSGTSISFGTPVLFESGGTYYTSIAYDANAQKVVIAYQDNGNFNRGTAIVGTVAGTSISFGTPVVFESASTAWISIAYDANAQKVVIAYRDSGNSSYGTAIVGTVSGTSISFGSAVVFDSVDAEFISISYDASAQKVVIAYKEDTNTGYGTAIVGTVAGTSISFSTPVVFESVETEFISTAYDANAQKVVIAYSGGKSSGVFTTATSNLTQSNFIGFSAANYTNGQTATVQVSGAVDDAQTGLTPGLAYYVQYDGSIGTSPADPNLNVFAGTAVATTKLIVKG